jgi:Arc/MetJ family transcription regulator
MPVTMTSIRLDTHLADEAAKVLGVKSRTEAIHSALREIVALKRFKKLMRKNAGKLPFAGHGE